MAINIAEDPNDVNILNNQYNGIAPYENMYIDVSLTAQRRNRSMLVIQNDNVELSNETGSGSVNFLGFNQNTSDYSNKHFTTNYYEGSTGDKTQYESFGIENIKITVNSSFIPQVNIKFVDIRGLSFFENEKSPYRILFDFPPPTFCLRVKGFYGKTIEYLLHLVKYTHEFKAENGNFYIDADFVAITFAPLSDILFRYIVNTSILSGSTSSNVIGEPQNTDELIKRIQSLYTGTIDKISTSSENQEFQNLKNDVTKVDDVFEELSKVCFKDDNEIGNPLLFFSKQQSGAAPIATKINNIGEVVKYLNTGDISNKIYIGYIKKEIANGNSFNVELLNAPYVTKLNDIIKAIYNYYPAETKPTVLDVEFQSKNANIILLSAMNGGTYKCVEITTLLTVINKDRNVKKEKMMVLSNELNELVNDAVANQLGVKPTIYNIFKIILDDVDTFFSILNSVSKKAKTHHNRSDIISKIVTSLTTYESKDILYPFPSIFGTQTNGGVSQEILISPKEISDSLSPDTFPEIDFVDEFLKTFANQTIGATESLETKIYTDENPWIPNTPLNTKLRAQTIGYPDMSTTPFMGDNAIYSILKTLLNRFYIVSQYTYDYDGDDFFNADDNVEKQKIAEIYGAAEAVNIAASIDNIDSLKSFRTYIKKYINDTTGFLTDMSKNCINYITINEKEISNNGYGTDLIYIEKGDKFIGCYIANNVNELTDPTDGPLNKYFDVYKSKWYNLDKKDIKISEDNVLIFKDNPVDDYIGQSNYLRDALNSQTCFTNVIGYNYWYKRNKIYEFYNNANISDDVKKMFMLSMLGNLIIPIDLFKTQGIYETPKFYIYLIGSILNDKNSVVFNSVINFLGELDMLEVYINRLKKIKASCDLLISNSDIQTFIKEYDMFSDSEYENIYISVKMLLTSDSITNFTECEKSLLSGGEYYDGITVELMTRKYLVLTTNRLFKETTTTNSYMSIKDIYTNNTTKFRNGVNKYFTSFLKVIDGYLEMRENKLVKVEKDIKNMVNDPDIINQTYYSFKKIHDKWLTSPQASGDKYPFNVDGGNLIDSFIFVDRAMNPIGDTVINPEPLIDLFNDPNATLLTVLSQLLSSNNFEFFPLQNFMVGSNDFIESAFKLDVSGKVNNKACFVCMYVGGYSQNNPTQIGNGFNDDGIKTLNDLSALSEFGESTSEIDKGEFYKNVNAFNVNFGTQNQSMFTDLKIDSKEFPETNEAIQILSRLVGDESTTRPRPKGQNLYNLYQNRAYSATVSGLGNVMIQPTQYFQINNVPLYNGVYLILTVEHNITPNFMKTNFMGTKVAKYPQKRVTDASAIVTYEGDLAGALNYNNSLTSPIPIDNHRVITALNDITLNNITIKQFNAPINPDLVKEVSTLFGGRGGKHKGIDFSADEDVSIWAAHDGKLSQHIEGNGDVGYGKYVVLTSNDGKYLTIYGHLSSYHFDTKIDDFNDVINVKTGEVIGFVGNSGHSIGATGMHLHFELRMNPNSNYRLDTPVDPIEYIRRAMGANFFENKISS